MPRAGLTTASVVAEAANLADEVGYGGLTLAALAVRFRVAVPSLYKHVGGLDDVRRGVAVLAVRELGAALAAAVAAAADGDAGARMRALANAYRGYARAHPGRYAATVRAAAPGDEDHVAVSQAVLDTVFGVLAERGLRGNDAIDATRALRACLHGFVALEAAGGFGLPQDVPRSFERMIDWLDRGFADQAPLVGPEAIGR